MISSCNTIVNRSIHASLVKIYPLVQKIAHGNHILDVSKWPCELENKVKFTKI